ncbi:hypothetical protein BAE44_0024759, partial [Dichanthelium oligosanthes]
LWFKKGSIFLKIQRSAAAMTSSSSPIRKISVRTMMMASSSPTPRTQVPLVLPSRRRRSRL